MLATKLITAATFKAVDVEEMRHELRISSNAEDDIILNKVKTAVLMAENFTNRKLCTQTFDYYINNLDELYIRLPYGQLQTVTNIKYYDTVNILQTWADTNYQVVTNSEPGYVYVLTNYPSTYSKPEAVIIRFVCGFTSKENIPEPIRDAIKLMASHLFENRQQVMIVTGALSIQEVPIGFYDLLAPYVIIGCYD